jgi:Pyridoxamine 5'-phosphate oxidase
MATRTTYQEANIGGGSGGVTSAVTKDGGQRIVARLTGEQVWQALAKASFAVVSYVTPSGEPRSSGVVYKLVDRRLYTAVAPWSWKAKHIATRGRVAVTVPVRRGGILSLVAAIPPATISFHGRAIVHQAGSPETPTLLKELGSLIPAERRATGWVIEIVPEGQFLTYALGVPLRKMIDPVAAQARAPV